MWNPAHVESPHWRFVLALWLLIHGDLALLLTSQIC